MTYLEFIKQKPVLYGQIDVNRKTKIGSFRLEENKYAGYIYQYYTEKGNRGTGGFTIQRAFNLFKAGVLSLVPAYGLKSNYIY